MGVFGDYVDTVLEHSIYLRPPDSPVSYKPWAPSGEPTMSPARTMLPVPRDSVASQECVEENPIVETKSHGTKVPSPSHAYEYAPKTKSHGTKVPSPSRACEYAPKHVTWKDIILPRCQPNSSPSPRMTK